MNQTHIRSCREIILIAKLIFLRKPWRDEGKVDVLILLIILGRFSVKDGVGGREGRMNDSVLNYLI